MTGTFLRLKKKAAMARPCRSGEGDQNHDREDQGEDRDALENTVINK